MGKIRVALILAAIFSIQPSFADNQDMWSSNSKPCATVAKACLSAGFVMRTETPNKRFWQDCMKPVILGQTVQGVTMDPNTVKTCRTDKINQLQDELKELQKVS